MAPAVKPYRDALAEGGFPLAQSAVGDIEAGHDRLVTRGVVFTATPTEIGNGMVAVFNDTRGSLIQLFAPKPAPA